MKLFRLLLRVTKVTTEHQKWSKMGRKENTKTYISRQRKPNCNINKIYDKTELNIDQSPVYFYISATLTACEI